MLTQRPKDGDKIICIGRTAYLTEGQVYDVYVDCGDAYVRDDDGDDYELHTGRWASFDLIPPEHEDVGEITQTTAVAPNIFVGLRKIELTVDEKGYKSIRKLVEASAKGNKRKELESKIAELQKELDALAT